MKLFAIVFFTLFSFFLKAQQGYNLDKKLLSNSEIITKCDRELLILRNIPYARKGYKFTNEYLYDYFSYYPWYSPIGEVEVQLNDIEEKNIYLIKEEENRRKKQRVSIIKFFSFLKKEIATQNESYILNLLKISKTQQDEFSLSYLTKVLSKINLDDIHYFKDKGLYKVEEDNGFVVMVYFFLIKGNDNEINVIYNYQRHTELMEDFDGCIDYMSEDEVSYNWIFTIDKENTIKFKNILIAG